MASDSLWEFLRRGRTRPTDWFHYEPAEGRFGSHLSVSVFGLVRLHHYGKPHRVRFYVTRAHRPHFVIAFDPWPRIVP